MEEEGRSPWGPQEAPLTLGPRYYRHVESLPGPETGDRRLRGNSSCPSELEFISQEAGPALGAPVATPEALR